MEPEWNRERAVWVIGETETHWFEIMPLIFTSALVVTPKGQDEYHVDRWCYHTFEDACAAFDAWDYKAWPETEPAGWHRHPPTGRRRENGDPSTEEIRH